MIKKTVVKAVVSIKVIFLIQSFRSNINQKLSTSMILHVLLLYQFVHQIAAIFTTPPIWITSNYVRAGNENVIATRTNETASPVPSHTFTFSSPLNGTPHLGYGIKAYEGYDYLGQEIFQINRTYLDRFQFSVAVKIIGVTNILLLNVPYIAIDPNFPHHLNSFDNVPVNYSAGVISNISTPSTISIQTYTNVINYTTQASGLTHNTFQAPFNRNKVLLFITSMNFYGTIENNNPPPYRPITFKVQTQVISVDQYQIVITLGKELYITKLHFSMIIFDQTDVESTGQYMIVHQTVELPYTGGFVPVPVEFTDNFIMGLLYFSSNKTVVILDFQWNFTTVAGTHGVFMPQSVGQTNKGFGTETVNRVGYTLFYLKTWYCPDQTYFDPAQDLCTGCPIINCINCYNLTVCSICDQVNDFFHNADSTQCIACTLDGCLNCTNLTTCETCNASDEYSLVNQTCFKCTSVPNTFLNTTTEQCELCILSGCLICSSLTQCLECDTNSSYYFLPNTSTCAYCNHTDNYLLINQSCIACLIQGCKLCSSLDACQTCSSQNGYYLNGTICLFDCSILGNCPTNSTIYKPSEDSYVKSGCNQFTYKFSIPSQLLPNCLQSAYFQTPGLSVIKTSLYSNQAVIDISYSRDIYKQSVFLTIPCGSASFELVLTYQPMVPPIYYTQSDCAAQENITHLLTAVQIISYILLLMSLLSCKIVGLELFGVLQLAYFSLGSYDYYNIYLHPLTEFKTFNGLNIPFFSQSSDLPQSLRQMKLASSFLNNFNIMLVVFLGQLIISITVYLISKLSKLQKMEKLAKRLLKQGFITLVLFNVFNIAFSAGVNWKFSDPSQASYPFDIVAIVVCIVVITISSMALQSSDEEQYGEFKKKFKDNCVCKFYVLLSILYRFAIGLYLALHTEYPESTLLVLAFSLAFIMYNIINLPFKSALQNYRCNFIHITQLVTLFAANYYREMKMYSPMNIKAKIYTPAILQLILIVLCIAFSAIVLVYQIVLSIRQWAKSRKTKQLNSPNKIHNESNETLAGF